MIKIIIADDEADIIDNIKDIIKYQIKGFDVIGTATDGNKALQLLNGKKADIILLDIKMPGKDGIEVLKYIYKNKIDIYTVILSGHKNFEYARKALQFKAVDYLLKPIDIQTLVDVLEKIKVNYNKKTDLKERDFLLNIINDQLGKGGHGFQIENYLLFLPILICTGPFRTAFYKSENNVNLPDMNSLIIPLLPKINKCKFWIIDGKNEAEKIIILGVAKKEKPDEIDIANNLFKGLNKLKISVTIITGTYLFDLKHLTINYQKLKMLLRKRLIIDKSQIIFYSEVQEEDKSFIDDINLISSHLERKISYAIKNSNLELFKKELEKCFDEWETDEYPQILVEKLIKYIITLTLGSFTIKSNYELVNIELEINQLISFSRNYEDLFKRLFDFIETLFSKKNNSEIKVENEGILVEKIEKYIKANLTEPIDTQIIADKIGLFPAHLSKIFKKHKGITATQYLIDLKIETAKDLIENHSDILIKDIAEILGYSDPYYFSRIFKKKTGKYPSDYKK